MSDRIQFRPHHFLCALGFQGKGYSDLFTANMAEIVERLRAAGGDLLEIEVTLQADHICTPCPHRRGTGCAKSEQIARLDARHAAALDLEDGQRLSWGEAQARIRRNVPAGALPELCAGCQWLELGLCERALSALHARE